MYSRYAIACFPEERFVRFRVALLLAVRYRYPEWMCFFVGHRLPLWVVRIVYRMLPC